MAGESSQSPANVFRPQSSEEIADFICEAVADGAPVEVVGNGTKRALGRPIEARRTLDLSNLTGIVTYEPEELVLTVHAGTPVAEIDAAISAHNQMLAFEPADYGALLGAPAGGATIGGVIGAACAGPRRIKAGGARDHILGLKGVSGRGEVFKAGGRVVKNVTGYDLPKLLTGSFGTLAAMTEITLKLAPAPEAETSLMLRDQSDDAAIRALTLALQSACDVSGAAHLPTDIGEAGRAATALRLEGFAPSVADRSNALRQLLSPFGEVTALDGDASRGFWARVRDVTPFHPSTDDMIWRLSVPPADGAEVGKRLRHTFDDARLFYDWGGGLIWLALSSEDPKTDFVRSIIPHGRGHATLLRAPADVRAHACVFPPLDVPLHALTARVKAQFDPKRVLNPGRMYPDI